MSFKQWTKITKIWLLQVKELNPDADIITEHIPSLLKFSTNIIVQIQKGVKSNKLYTLKKKKKTQTKMFLWLKAYYEFII